MSTRRLRARLERLTKSMNNAIEKKGPRPFEFPIDVTLAKAISDDFDRLYALQRERTGGSRSDKSPESEEERLVRAQIAEKAKTISCPPHYGFKERWDDYLRRGLLGANGFEEKWDGFDPDVTVYDVEDVEAERAQLRARIAAFDHSPEGLTRLRIDGLLDRGWWRINPEEYAELDRLIALYPEPWCHPGQEVYKRWMEHRYRSPEQRKKSEENRQESLRWCRSQGMRF